MPGPSRWNRKAKARNDARKGASQGGRTASERGFGRSMAASGRAVSRSNLRAPKGSRVKAVRQPRIPDPLKLPEVQSAVERLRDKYRPNRRTPQQEGLSKSLQVSRDQSRAERKLENTTLRSMPTRGEALKAERQVRDTTQLNAEGTRVERLAGATQVGNEGLGAVQRAAERGKLRREGKQFTTPKVRRTQRKVKRAKRQLRKAKAAVASGGMPANVPPEYAKWIRKFSPRIDKQAREVYGMSGNEFMAKMLQGESGFDMSKVGPNTPYGNARGAAQFIPPTRDAFVEKFGIDPWRSTKEAVQAMALHLDGKSFSKTFGIQGYNPGINDSYYLNQDVGPTVRANPKARARLDRAKAKATAIDRRAAKLGLAGVTTGKSEDRYKGPLPDGGTSWPLAIKGKMGGGPEDHAARAFGNWQSDNAVDIEVPVGTPVKAVEDGTISRISGSAPNHSGNPAGWSVYLKGRGGEEYFYAHLEEYSVKAGDRVRRGQQIGTSGAANSVPHLHLATKNKDPREAISGEPQTDKPKFVNYSKKGGRGSSSTKWLAPTGGNEVLKFQRPLAEALIGLARASGEPIRVNSAFRSNQEQAELYRDYLNGTGNLAAPPGQSNHNHGAAADVELTPKQRELASQFGLGFPVAGEDWHIELVGDAASQISDSGGGGGYSMPSSGGGSGSTSSSSTGPVTREQRRKSVLRQLRDLGYSVTSEGIRRTGLAAGSTVEAPESVSTVKRRYGIK